MLIATTCGFSYGIMNENIALIVNYGPMIILDVTALGMRIYYAYFYVDKGHIEICHTGHTGNTDIETIDDHQTNIE